MMQSRSVCFNKGSGFDFKTFRGLNSMKKYIFHNCLL